MRLDRAQFVGADHLEVGDAVGFAAPLEVGQTVEFALVGGDDHFAAALRADAVLGAEGVHPLGALNGHARLGRAGAVVEAGVNHAAVVAALVLSDRGFLLERDNPQPLVRLAQGHRRRKAENPGPNHRHIRVDLVCHG